MRFSQVLICLKVKRESHSVVSDSLRPHGLYSNSPGQNIGTFPCHRGSSQPRDRTQVSRIAGRFFTNWATREDLFLQHNWLAMCHTLLPWGPCKWPSGTHLCSVDGWDRLYFLCFKGCSVCSNIFCCSVAKSCLTLCDPMDCSSPGFPVLYYLLEFA